ncbi:MAG: AbrB/MazE/SpoVT family DNA-binding domain-containing protein [Sulfolobus sp.]|nr:AbrB/MazE/SpoVT family DNA-binding domain-containing protein [Sulfolobus sp.]
MKVKVDKKGRVSIPAEIRDKLGIKEGSELEVTYDHEKIIMKPLSKVDEYAGIFKGPKLEGDTDKVFYEAFEEKVKKDY